MKREFKMLIGDDAFTDDGIVEDTMLLILSEISSVTKIPFKEGNIIGGVYFCKNFPTQQFSEAKITFASSVQDMIDKGKDTYDWIVTDLNYGPGQETGGIEILENLASNPARKILFTSEDLSVAEVDELVSAGFNCVLFPKFLENHKSKVAVLGERMGFIFSVLPN